MTDGIKVTEVIKKSFRALLDEPGFIGLYILSLLLTILPSIHPSWGFENIIETLFIESGISFFLIKNIFWIVIFFLSSIVLTTIALAGIIQKTEARENGKYLGFLEAISPVPPQVIFSLSFLHVLEKVEER